MKPFSIPRLAGFVRVALTGVAAAVHVVGAVAAAPGDGDAKALYGASLFDLAGVKTVIAPANDAPLVVNFWARWCVPCRDEMPVLNAAAHARVASGLRVVGIAIDDDAGAVRDFATAYDIDYALALTGSGADAIGLMRALGNDKAGVPFTIVIDRAGRIVGRKIGPIDADELERMLGAVR